ncbi:MAG: RICIN domain-containing protein [Acidimicrobiales bacterium]
MGSRVDRQNCNGGPAQNVEVVGDFGVVALRFTEPVNAGLCMAIDPVDASRIVMATCNGSAAQLFNLIDNFGSYIFESIENGRCLDGSAKLRARSCNGNPDRNFIF